MKRILLFGGNGMLGSTLKLYLEQELDAIITIAGRSDSCNFITSMKDEDEISDIIRACKPEIIVNLVGSTSVDLCHTDVDHALNTNILPSKFLASAANEFSVKTIHISTDHVYDAPGLNGEMNVKIVNEYAASKYIGEAFFLDKDNVVLRTNFIGKSLVDKKESLTDWVLQRLRLREPTYILDDVYFSPLTMIQLSSYIVEVMNKFKPGVYNLGSIGGMSKAEFDLKFIAEIGGNASSFHEISVNEATFLKIKRPQNMIMDCSKFQETFNVKLPTTNEVVGAVSREYKSEKF